MLKAKKAILIIVALILVGMVAFWYTSNNVYSIHGNRIMTVVVENQKFNAEVVSSDEKLWKGLGGRDGLCQKCAMLFDFFKNGRYPFWMKNMHFPLDIIWISNGKIVHIEKDVPENFSGTIVPSVDADRVLEINAGIADKIGIKVGDSVSF